MSIKLVVGLCNPGAAYAETRHNAGGWFAEMLVKHCSASFKSHKKLFADIAEVEIEHHQARILLSHGFMNHSGTPVRAVSQFYRIQPDEILVAHDELDLEVGRIKLKTGGGHGGHNGLRNIIQQLGSSDFHRLRIGIGHPGHKDLVHNYVLNKPSQQDRVVLFDVIERAITIMPMVLGDDLADAMTKLNC